MSGLFQIFPLRWSKIENMQVGPIELARSKPIETQPETDPVCKMLVTPETAAAKYDFEGKTYYFCNPGCKAKFAANPQKYLSTAEPSTRGETERGHADHSESAIRNPKSEIDRPATRLRGDRRSIAMTGTAVRRGVLGDRTAAREREASREA